MANLQKIYRWIPGLYIMQGLGFSLVTAVSIILYKNFDFNNTKIAFYTSLFTIPWLLKPVLAPVVENIATKRSLILSMQFLIAALFFLLALSLAFKPFFYISALLFFIIALFASIHDMNVDGFYIVSLNKQEQAHFIGVRTVCYQLGSVLCQGGLIFFVGSLFSKVNIITTWQIGFMLLASLVLIIAFYHTKFLPVTEKKLQNANVKSTNTLKQFQNVYAELLKIPNLIYVVLFTLIYNLPQDQLIKIVPLFLIDKTQHGGLALSIAAVGIINGGMGIAGMLIGVLVSGFLLTKTTLQRCLLPLTIFAGLANAGYFLLSIMTVHSAWGIGFFVMLAQFGFGLSNGAYMLCLLHNFGRGIYSMSLYAVGTAIMGLSVAIGGAISGYMQSILGYTGFFAWIILLNIGILLFTFYIIKRAIINIKPYEAVKL